jgi:hypothetical protein
MGPLREPELLLALRGEVARHLTYKLAAEHLGISASNPSDTSPVHWRESDSCLLSFLRLMHGFRGIASADRVQVFKQRPRHRLDDSWHDSGRQIDAILLPEHHPVLRFIVGSFLEFRQHQIVKAHAVTLGC